MPRKKIGHAGKFGPRYGMRLRRKWEEIEEKQRIFHECPVCKKISVKRIASGIWECRRCGAKFSGGAYMPYTGISKTIESVVKKMKEENEEHV